ncbi:hypothetical protein BU15DRAFT_60169 [Melanogaster broomeanus]|nr:hypothetical protein BU15DRAFT_60169 [Melanogaster broomeanus]
MWLDIPGGLTMLYSRGTGTMLPPNNSSKDRWRRSLKICWLMVYLPSTDRSYTGWRGSADLLESDNQINIHDFNLSGLCLLHLGDADYGRTSQPPISTASDKVILSTRNGFAIFRSGWLLLLAEGRVCGSLEIVRRSPIIIIDVILIIGPQGRKIWAHDWRRQEGSEESDKKDTTLLRIVAPSCDLLHMARGEKRAIRQRGDLLVSAARNN